MFTNKKRTLLFIGAFALLISGIFFWKTNTTSGTTYSEEYKQGIRNALAEISFPTGSDAVAARGSSDSLANFIYYRSGVQLNQTNKDSLAQTQQRSAQQSKGITQTQLAQILTDVAFEKLVNLSDANISYMADSMCGFNSPNLSAAYRDGRRFVRLRANGEGTMEPAYFVDQLKYARDAERGYRQSSSYPPLLTQANRMALNSRIINEISTRANALTAADPNFFGGSKGVTPTQAILLTYSVVTNDSLNGNQSQIQTRMLNGQQDISQFWNEPYPSPQGYKAFGANGYLYSTPADLLLDDAGISRVLTLINERSNLQ